MPDALRVTVVVDRTGRSRGEFWTDLLDDMRTRQVLDTVVTLAPVSDLVVAPLVADRPALLETIESGTDVLVLNWDVINGDPDFGGDTALDWFTHRQLALREWLNRGGMLIVEGQAALGVPDERYYAAVLGPGEVGLSGLEDRRDPSAQGRRMVGDCRMTRTGRRAPGFGDLEEIRARPTLTYDELFPPESAGRLVARYIRRVDFSRMLYRGWFRPTVRGTTLSWVPYIRRARRWPRNYPTLLVAKCGSGVVYASTMLLSATKQTALLQAMLLTHGQVARLPEPGAARRVASRYALKVVPGFLTGLLLLLFTSSDPTRRLLTATAIGLLVTVALDLLPRLRRAAFAVVRTVTGH